LLDVISRRAARIDAKDGRNCVFFAPASEVQALHTTEAARRDLRAENAS
jgi:hypothetical protein